MRKLPKARFKRRILHTPNAIQTMHNEEAYLIIYCLNCIRCMQNSTFETGLILVVLRRLRLRQGQIQGFPGLKVGGGGLICKYGI